LDIIFGLGRTSSRKFDDSENSLLLPEDYSYHFQYKMNRRVDELLKFKDFAPKVFHQIRKQFDLTEADLLASFNIDNLYGIKGEGKSGAFLLFTKDHRFILKTCTKEERDFLWEWLPYYLQHIKKNKDTLVPRLFGVYSMKHEGIGGVIRFIIMNNVFNSNIYYDPLEKYDLKGSTVGRFVPEHKREQTSTLKDLDIKRRIWIPESLYKMLLLQLKSDAEFLAKHKVMDYSLLVGVHYETEENTAEIKVRVEAQQKLPESARTNTFRQSLFQTTEGGILGWNSDEHRKEYYYIGIIDILQRYNTRKKIGALF